MILSIALLFISAVTTEPPRPTLPAGALTLVLTTDKTAYTVAEEPVVSLYVVNNTETPVVLPRAQRTLLRPPHIGFEVTPPPGAFPETMLFGCGTGLPPVKVEAFVEVGPGKRLEILSGKLLEFSLKLKRGPGQYRVQATYSTNKPAMSWVDFSVERQSAEELLEDILPLLQQTPLVDLVSNELFLTFNTQHESPIEALKLGDVNEVESALLWVMSQQQKGGCSDCLSAVALALERLYPAVDPRSRGLVATAFSMILEHGQPNDMEPVWRILDEEAKPNAERILLEDHNSGSKFVKLALASDIDARLHRLCYLLNPAYVNRSGYGPCGPVVRLNATTVRLLDEATGFDVDQVLVELSESCVYQSLEPEVRQQFQEVLSARGLPLPTPALAE